MCQIRRLSFVFTISFAAATTRSMPAQDALTIDESKRRENGPAASAPEHAVIANRIKAALSSDDTGLERTPSFVKTSQAIADALHELKRKEGTSDMPVETYKKMTNDAVNAILADENTGKFAREKWQKAFKGITDDLAHKATTPNEWGEAIEVFHKSLEAAANKKAETTLNSAATELAKLDVKSDADRDIVSAVNRVRDAQSNAERAEEVGKLLDLIGPGLDERVRVGEEEQKETTVVFQWGFFITTFISVLSVMSKWRSKHQRRLDELAVKEKEHELLQKGVIAPDASTADEDSPPPPKE